MGLNKMMVGTIIFTYGIIFGSFYNVVIYRFPMEESIIRGRSFCPSCRTQLDPKDLMPVYSQLRLQNRCR